MGQETVAALNFFFTMGYMEEIKIINTAAIYVTPQLNNLTPFGAASGKVVPYIGPCTNTSAVGLHLLIPGTYKMFQKVEFSDDEIYPGERNFTPNYLNIPDGQFPPPCNDCDPCEPECINPCNTTTDPCCNDCDPCDSDCINPCEPSTDPCCNDCDPCDSDCVNPCDTNAEPCEENSTGQIQDNKGITVFVEKNQLRITNYASTTLSNNDYTIFGVTSQTLMQGQLQSETTTIDVTTLPSGVYFIKAGNSVRKFVKK